MSDPPVWPGDFPDPFVLRAAGAYWAYGTNAGPNHVQVLRSEDLVRWERAGNALPQMPAWAQAGFTWAPVVLPRQDRYVLYATVREPRSGRQAIMAGVAGSPSGPFVPFGDGPLVFQLDLGGSIDPSPFVDADGQAYLLWKADANALGRPSSLWAQPLAPDGLALTGPATELLTHDGAWERPLIEAPSLVRAGDRYFLFYSGGWWESDGYAVGYAVGDGPLGPWRKVTRSRPWFASDAGVSGPGGQEFFTDEQGAWWMAYHGWAPRQVGYPAGGRRTLRLARLSFVDGQPVLEGSPPSAPSWWQELRRRWR